MVVDEAANGTNPSRPRLAEADSANNYKYANRPTFAVIRYYSRIRRFVYTKKKGKPPRREARWIDGWL